MELVRSIEPEVSERSIANEVLPASFAETAITMDSETWSDIETDLRNYDDSRKCLRAVERLRLESTQEDIPRLLELLKAGEDFFIREAAAWPLAHLAGVQYLPELFAAYQKGFDDGHDNDGFT